MNNNSITDSWIVSEIQSFTNDTIYEIVEHSMLCDISCHSHIIKLNLVHVNHFE